MENKKIAANSDGKIPNLQSRAGYPAEAEARAVAAEERARLAEGRAEELDAELRGALRDVARLEGAITEMEEQLAMGEKRCGEKRTEVGRQLKECNGGRQRAMAQLHECEASLAAREEQEE
ncbi:unnamed protein product [Closterium sp. NIES-53]